MEDATTSREKILKKVRKALIHKSTVEQPDLDLESDIYLQPEDSLELLFAERFTKLNGKFVFCESTKDFANNFTALTKENNWSAPFVLDSEIKKLLDEHSIKFTDAENDFLNMDVSITLCESLVARTGSVMISSKQASGRRLNVFPNYHIVLAYVSQLVFSHKEAIKKLREKYGNTIPSLISSVTGPSRTADIEKTLVQGAHGPKEIYVFLVDDLNA